MFLNAKISIANYAEGNDSSNEPYQADHHAHYQYYGPPQNPQELAQRPNPLRRQVELLEGAIEPLREVFGPDIEVSLVPRTNLIWQVIM